MKPRSLASVLTVAIALTGCGSEIASVNRVPPPAPPPVVALVAPTPRAVGIPNVTPDIWAEFTEPLDPTTVNAHNVYLKIDEARVAIDVSYDPTRRRVVIRPQSPLALYVVYTVELSTSLKTEDGGAFPRTWFWQFTTVSIRRPSDPSPAHEAVDQSPHVTLGFGGIGATPGTAQFEIYAGADSNAVRDRLMPPVATLSFPIWAPGLRWAENDVTYWSVRAKNLTTGESVDGPLWSFRTLDPATAVLDSIQIPASIAGYQLQTNRNTRSCIALNLQLGPAYYTAIGWGINQLPEGVRVADARIRIASSAGGQSLLPSVSMWATRGSLDYCNLYDFPPVIQSHMGDARIIGTDLAIVSSEALAAHVEATRRYSTFYGYRVTCPQPFSIISPSGTSEQRPTLYVRFYR